MSTIVFMHNTMRLAAPLALDPELLAYEFEHACRLLDAAQNEVSLFALYCQDLDAELPRGAREAAREMAEEHRQLAARALANAAQAIEADSVENDAAWGPLLDDLRAAQASYRASLALLGTKSAA